MMPWLTVVAVVPAGIRRRVASGAPPVGGGVRRNGTGIEIEIGIGIGIEIEIGTTMVLPLAIHFP